MSLITKKELIERWRNPQAEHLLVEVTRCIKTGIPLSTVNGIGKFQGRWDLRGAPLSFLKREQEILANDYSYVQRTGSLQVRKKVIDSTDFSYAKISYSDWRYCKFSDCLFEGASLKEINVWACEFEKCIFTKADMSRSFLNMNIGANSGAYISCVFSKTDLTEASFKFPLIKNCIFEDCKLKATLFDGSRFEDCKFAGVVYDPIFSRYSIYASKSLLCIFNRVNPKDYPNEMKNVDFSEAQLIHPSFNYGMNLTCCIFPTGEDYIIIKDYAYTMQNVRRIIESEWLGEEKREGISMLDVVLFKKDKRDSGKNILLNMRSLSFHNSDLDRKFYNLIKEHN